MSGDRGLLRRANNNGDRANASLLNGAAGDREAQLQQRLREDVDFVRAVFAEFLGSFFTVYIGLGVVYISAVVTFDVVTIGRQLMISLAYSMSYAAALYALSFPSTDRVTKPNTRHLNPAVSFSLLFKGLRMSTFLIYVLAQFAGAGVGCLVLHYCSPINKQQILSMYPQVEGVNQGMIWWMEIIVSYVSLLTILITSFGHMDKQPDLTAAVREEAPQTHHEINCIIAGAVVFVCNAVGGPVSGGYMNPLFPLGAAMLSDRYLVGAFVSPLIGGFLAIVTGHMFGYSIQLA